MYFKFSKSICHSFFFNFARALHDVPMNEIHWTKKRVRLLSTNLILLKKIIHCDVQNKYKINV